MSDRRFTVTGMQPQRYLDLLRSDAARLREVAAPRLDAQVPSCPGWTVADLVEHTGIVYLHKAEALRLGRPPNPWPPPERADQPALQVFDDGLADVLHELTARDPDEPAWSWAAGEQTVAFWFRRMAQETVMHRVDAELASGAVTPADPELAADGVDEILRIMLAHPDWDSDIAAGSTFVVQAGDRQWTVRVEQTVEIADGAGTADATVSGAPHDVLLWLWGRTGDDTVQREGDVAKLVDFRRRLADATR